MQQVIDKNEIQNLRSIGSGIFYQICSNACFLCKCRLGNMYVFAFFDIFFTNIDRDAVSNNENSAADVIPHMQYFESCSFCSWEEM